MKNILKYNLFTILTVFLVVVLPFYVFIKVYFEYKLGVSHFGFFIKEFVIVLLFLSGAYEFVKRKKLPKFEILDYLIFTYFGYGILITFVNGLGLKSVFYGARYDYMFFVVFLIFRHSKQFLQIKIKKLLTIFMYSGITSLFFSILIKLRLKEDSLIVFGFTDYVSNWTYNGSIPTYHGLENSGIKRFQGIFDGPSAMGFFLIIYSYIFIYLQKKKNEFYVILTGLFFFILLFMTYSRSAMLGVFGSIGLLFLLNIKKIYKNYKKELLTFLIIGIVLSSLFGVIYKDKVSNVILRTSSTTGHFDRMSIGIDRFLEKPLGSGLAESGPAYRTIYPDKQTKEDEQYYIPESWFVQQLTEGGFIYFTLFLSIFGIILYKLYFRSKTIFALLIAILIMNIFLHIFEATYLSILLFIFVGLFCRKKYS